MTAFDHAGSWSATSIASSSISDAAADTTAAIDNDTKLGTNVSVEIAYGGTATEGVNVYLLRDVDGTNYEAVADGPWGFAMPYATSVTRRRTFWVPGWISKFKVHLTNDSGASVTATVRTQQAAQ